MKQSNLYIKIANLSLVFLLSISALSYHPIFADLVSESDAANPLYKYISLIAILTLALHFRVKEWLASEFIRKYVLFGVMAFAMYFVLLIFFPASENSDVKNVFMALTFILIGYSSRLSQKGWVVALLCYSMVVLYSTMMQIMQNLGGFVIQDLYLQYGKNQLGLITASVAIASCFIGLTEKNKKLMFILLLIACLALVFTITIRARAAFTTTFIILFLLIHKKMQMIKSNYAKPFILVFIVAAILSVLCLDSVNSYIVNSFTQNQGTDISSGRLERNVFAFNLILDSPFWGNLSLNKSYPLIHNYFLRVLSDYGLIGALFLMCLYIYFAAYSIRHVAKSNLDSNKIGYFIMLLPFILSLEEPTFPYAPGTAVILSFTMFGYTLKKDQKSII